MPFYKGSATPVPKANIVEKLEKELSKTQITKQVLLSFLSDPYCTAESNYCITYQVLKLLNKHNVPVAILTKGGSRCLRDLDLFKQFHNIKVGATLTFDNDRDSFAWEPGAALPLDRIGALRILHGEGITTWASFEPVIEPAQSLNLIKQTLPFIDQYKLGKWNHDPRADLIDWSSYVAQAVKILRDNGKQFYVKEDLRKYAHGLTPEESDMDYMSLTSQYIPETQISLF